MNALAKNNGTILFHFAGGGPKPYVSVAMHLCMEVMARESLEGIRGRNTEVDPSGTATSEMSQVRAFLHFKKQLLENQNSIL